MLGDSKKAMELLGTHENKLSKDTNLFGADFFTCLAKKTKSHKDGANIMQELGSKVGLSPASTKKNLSQSDPRGGYFEIH